jgi:hypothetical protein
VNESGEPAVRTTNTQGKIRTRTKQGRYCHGMFYKSTRERQHKKNKELLDNPMVTSVMFGCTICDTIGLMEIERGQDIICEDYRYDQAERKIPKLATIFECEDCGTTVLDYKQHPQETKCVGCRITEVEKQVYQNFRHLENLQSLSDTTRSHLHALAMYAEQRPEETSTLQRVPADLQREQGEGMTTPLETRTDRRARRTEEEGTTLGMMRKRKNHEDDNQEILEEGSLIYQGYIEQFSGQESLKEEDGITNDKWKPLDTGSYCRLIMV